MRWLKTTVLKQNIWKKSAAEERLKHRRSNTESNRGSKRRGPLYSSMVKHLLLIDVCALTENYSAWLVKAIREKIQHHWSRKLANWCSVVAYFTNLFERFLIEMQAILGKSISCLHLEIGFSWWGASCASNIPYITIRSWYSKDLRTKLSLMTVISFLYENNNCWESLTTDLFNIHFV